MSEIYLTFDNRDTKVRFSKDERKYYADLRDLVPITLADTIVVDNKLGNFRLLFSDRKPITQNEKITSYIYQLQNDERGIVFQLFV